MSSPVSPRRGYRGGASQESTEDETISPLAKKRLHQDDDTKSHDKKKKRKRKSETKKSSKKKKKKHHHHDSDGGSEASPARPPKPSSIVPSDDKDAKVAAASPVKSGGKMAAAKSKHDSTEAAAKKSPSKRTASKKGPPKPLRVAEPEDKDETETTKQTAASNDAEKETAADDGKSSNQEDGEAAKPKYKYPYPSPEFRFLKAMDAWIHDELEKKGYSKEDLSIPDNAFPGMGDILQGLQEKYKANDRPSGVDRLRTMGARLDHLKSCAKQSKKPYEMHSDTFIVNAAKKLKAKVDEESITEDSFFKKLSEQKKCYLTARAKKMVKEKVLDVPDNSEQSTEKPTKSAPPKDGQETETEHERGGRYPDRENALLKAVDDFVIKQRLAEQGYKDGDHPISDEAFPSVGDIITHFQEKYKARGRIVQKHRVEAIAERLVHLKSCASGEHSTEPNQIWGDPRIVREAKDLYKRVDKETITAKSFFLMLSEQRNCFLTNRGKKMLVKKVLELPDEDEESLGLFEMDEKVEAATKTTDQEKKAKKPVATKPKKPAPPKDSQDTETEHSEEEDEEKSSKGKRKGSEDKEETKPPAKRARANSTSSAAKSAASSTTKVSSSSLDTKLQKMQEQWEKKMGAREKERESIESKMNRWKESTKKDYETMKEEMTKLQSEIEKANSGNGAASSSKGDNQELLVSLRNETKESKKEITELKKRNTQQSNVIKSQKTEIENLKRMLKKAKGDDDSGDEDDEGADSGVEV